MEISTPDCEQGDERVSGGFKKWLTHDPEDRPAERGFVRIFVPALFIVCGVAAGLISHHTETAPGVVFNNHLIYAGLLFLILFYGFLLLALPLARAIFAGELPTELTTKGPRYPEKELESSKKAAVEIAERIDDVEKRLKDNIEKVASSSGHAMRDLEGELGDLRGELERFAAAGRKRRFPRFR